MRNEKSGAYTVWMILLIAMLCLGLLITAYYMTKYAGAVRLPLYGTAAKGL